MIALPSLLVDVLLTLDELRLLLMLPALDTRFYRRVLGPHTRHVLDHFDALLAGWSAGVVDYDARGRDPRTEQDREVAAARLAELRTRLNSLADAAPGRPLWIRSRTATDRDAEAIPSTLARELQFLQSHTVHHLALVRAHADITGVELPEDMGKAPSTLALDRLRGTG
ncbi:MAG: hypothetical protein ABF296_09265 [Oceanococcaceae bacterium]